MIWHDFLCQLNNVYKYVFSKLSCQNTKSIYYFWVIEQINFVANHIVVHTSSQRVNFFDFAQSIIDFINIPIDSSFEWKVDFPALIKSATRVHLESYLSLFILQSVNETKYLLKIDPFKSQELTDLPKSQQKFILQRLVDLIKQMII
ncbi:hypothetical protein HZS_3889 [Henneguya salminicola]|nr:hypothetical protein HZS_3889 [Henneguya salminicola]